MVVVLEGAGATANGAGTGAWVGEEKEKREEE